MNHANLIQELSKIQGSLIQNIPKKIADLPFHSPELSDKVMEMPWYKRIMEVADKLPEVQKEPDENCRLKPVINLDDPHPQEDDAFIRSVMKSVQENDYTIVATDIFGGGTGTGNAGKQMCLRCQTPDGMLFSINSNVITGNNLSSHTISVDKIAIEKWDGKSQEFFDVASVEPADMQAATERFTKQMTQMIENQNNNLTAEMISDKLKLVAGHIRGKYEQTVENPSIYMNKNDDWYKELEDIKKQISQLSHQREPEYVDNVISAVENGTYKVVNEEIFAGWDGYDGGYQMECACCVTDNGDMFTIAKTTGESARQEYTDINIKPWDGRVSPQITVRDLDPQQFDAALAEFASLTPQTHFEYQMRQAYDDPERLEENVLFKDSVSYIYNMYVANRVTDVLYDLDERTIDNLHYQDVIDHINQELKEMTQTLPIAKEVWNCLVPNPGAVSDVQSLQIDSKGFSFTFVGGINNETRVTQNMQIPLSKEAERSLQSLQDKIMDQKIEAFLDASKDVMANQQYGPAAVMEAKQMRDLIERDIEEEVRTNQEHGWPPSKSFEKVLSSSKTRTAELQQQQELKRVADKMDKLAQRQHIPGRSAEQVFHSKYDDSLH